MELRKKSQDGADTFLMVEGKTEGTDGVSPVREIRSPGSVRGAARRGPSLPRPGSPLAGHAAGEANFHLYANVSGAVLKSVDPVGLAPPTPRWGDTVKYDALTGEVVAVNDVPLKNPNATDSVDLVSGKRTEGTAYWTMRDPMTGKDGAVAERDMSFQEEIDQTKERVERAFTEDLELFMAARGNGGIPARERHSCHACQG